GPTLTKVDDNILKLSGTTDNAFLAVIAEDRIVVLAKNPSTGIVHAVGGGLTVESGARVELGGPGGDQICNGTSVTVKSGGTLDFKGRSETIGQLTLTGTG